MDDLTTSKIEALFVILSLSLFFSFIPLKIRSCLIKNSKISQKLTELILSSCLCFGAGVLLSTVFLHIFPETDEKVNDLMALGYIRTTIYPLSELILCSGFFFIYSLEEIVHLWIHHHHHHQESSTTDLEHKYSKTNRKHQLERTQRTRCESNCSMAIIVGCLPSNESVVGNMSVKSDYKNDLEFNQITIQVQETVSLLRSVLMILALSFHGIFEGLALGLEDSTYGVWLFCLAVCSHKIFIALSIGMELLEAGISKGLYVLHMTVFSLASPLGAAIGTILYKVIDGSNSAGLIAIAVLQGISGGTILFVVFCEILERERTKRNGRFVRFLAIIFGFAIIAGLQAIQEPTNDSGGDFSSTPISVLQEHI